MTTMVSQRMHARIRARRACFTRPEYRTERVSAIAPSHAACEGTLSQVMGHKGCRFTIERVGLLFWPRLLTLTGNEIHDFGDGSRPVDAQKHRTLRTTTLLAGKKRAVKAFDGQEEIDAGVDFVVTFRLLYPDPKYLDMLLSRLRNGRHYGTHPYLGIRECPAKIETIHDLREIDYPSICTIEHKDGLRTVNLNESLGLSFHGTDWDDPCRPNYFAPLDISRGVIRFPTWPEVRKLGIKRGAAA